MKLYETHLARFKKYCQCPVPVHLKLPKFDDCTKSCYRSKPSPDHTLSSALPDIMVQIDYSCKVQASTDNGVPPPVMTATVEPIPGNSTNMPVKHVSNTCFSITALISIFLMVSVMLVYIYFNFPTLNADEKKFIKLPWNITDAQNLGRVLEKHKDRHKVEVFVSLVFVYILYPLKT
ncbi:uncharacterized protein LOC103521381 isoform X1 [Diaphorina citri]|uniref:Uncharacterized protein LOC103521381 isoform X1 n=1 Tax=Diaphorina citri TaxID=121845 RepID=A0A1S3DNY7_DIACI|nr:uncharacterized protein LOC103521381 isoform X1 [Diaphorina citri]